MIRDIFNIMIDNIMTMAYIVIRKIVKYITNRIITIKIFNRSMSERNIK